MNIRFEPVLENYGFDASAAPPWLMVASRGEMPLWMINGEGLTARSINPTIATAVVETGSKIKGRVILRVKGVLPGNTFVDILAGNRVIQRLEVAVKSPVKLNVSFHFVSDSAQPVAHSTNRTPAELGQMIFWLNSIYQPQTNITFTLKDFFNQKFKGNMGSAVNFNMDSQGRPIKGHEWNLVTSKRDLGAHINVFFVWRNEFITLNARGKREVSGALGYIIGDGRDCMIQDWNGYEDRDNDGVADNSAEWETARMLAHEIGHVLGIHDVMKTRRQRRIDPGSAARIERIVVNPHYVMGSGPFIPKMHANIMHAIAKQIARG